MNIYCNAGVSTTNLIADLPGFGEVWYAPQGIANILLLSKMKKKYCVTYDSTDTNPSFIVHKNNGNNRIFRESPTGLVYWDTAGVTVNTVKEKKTKYTARAYQGVIDARKLQNIIGRPSSHSYLNIVSTNSLPNCPNT
jgi:hypothetical protein